MGGMEMRLPRIPPPTWPMYRLTEEHDEGWNAIVVRLETLHRGEKVYTQHMITDEYAVSAPPEVFRRVIEDLRDLVFRKTAEHISRGPR